MTNKQLADALGTDRTLTVRYLDGEWHAWVRESAAVARTAREWHSSSVDGPMTAAVDALRYANSKEHR